MKKFLIILAAVFVLLAGCTALVVGTATDDPAPAPSATIEPAPVVPKVSDDVVEVLTCEKGSYGSVSGKVRIVNNGRVPKTYLITVSANDASGKRIVELNGIANSIASKQEAEVEVMGVVSEGAPEIDKCVIAAVDSYES
jgi:hypothetical protein